MTARQLQLGEVVDIQTGHPFKSSGYATSGAGVRLLRGDNVGQGTLRWAGAKRWPTADGHTQFALDVGDVVLAMDRPWIDAGLKFASVRSADLPCLLVQRVARLRAKGGLRQDYLRYLIASPGFTAHVLALQTGTAVPHISATQIRSFTLLLPDESTQARIAAVLQALDEKIDVNLRIASNAEDLAVETAAAAADLAQWVELGQLAEHSKATIDPAAIDGLVDHFSIPAFDAGRRPVREPSSEIKSNKLSVPDRAVLVSRLNPRIPRVWFVRTEAGVPAVCSTEFLVLRPTSGVSEGALFAACSHPDVLADMTRRAGGTSGSHQRVKPADALAVAVPNPNGEVVQGLTPLLEAAAHARREAANLAEIRNTLLPKLLSGELQVGSAEDDLAEASV